MFQIENRTPFNSELFVCANPAGVDSLYLVVKASFECSNFTLSDEQVPIFKQDEYWGEPAKSSIKFPSDYGLSKVATDLVVVGHAMAPQQQPVRELDVSFQLGAISKKLKVFGDRYWEKNRFSSPGEFVQMPLVYEKAYGGKQHEFNDIGCGVNAHEKESDPVLLPNIEDPNDLISSRRHKPLPAGFAALSPNWLPRAQYCGTFDDSWQKKRAPFLPLDFDPKFLNVAARGMTMLGHLRGGEHVRISNMNEQGDVRFDLPKFNFACRVLIGVTTVDIPVVTETVLLEPNQNRVSLTWKAEYEGGARVHKVRSVKLTLKK